MAQNLYIAGTESQSGKSLISLGVMELLSRRVGRLGFFRPIIRAREHRDNDIELIRHRFCLEWPYESMYACTHEEARQMVAEGQYDGLLRRIFTKYKTIEPQCDFVLCEGTDFTGISTAFEFEFNASVANHLGAPVLILANGQGKSPEELVSLVRAARETFEGHGCVVVATIVNRIEPDSVCRIHQQLTDAWHHDDPIYTLPEQNALGKPTVSRIADVLHARVVDPAQSEWLDEFSQSYFELRKHKGVTPEAARDAVLDASYFGTMMVQKGLADGMVSGSVHTTAHTIRPAFEIIRTRPGSSIISSVFLMCLKDRVLVYGDCAVNPTPKPHELADIAISSAATAEMFGIEPRVAMLSYSTGESGKGADVDKVRQATQIAKELRPDLMLEGPIQYDAAIDPGVARTKMPDSEVAGRASVFVFPDLNTGNNTY